MTAFGDTVPPAENGLGNGPGKPFAQSRSKMGVLKYVTFRGNHFTWRNGDVSPSEAYMDTLRDNARKATVGFVFQASALRKIGFKVFRTGDYHIPTTLQGVRDIVKFQTTEYLPGEQEWDGPRDIAHLAFLSVGSWELPVYHFWVDPVIFQKKADEMTQAELIDEEIDRLRSEEEAQQDPDMAKTRLMPNISPMDQIWKDKLAQFQEILVNHKQNNQNKSLMDLINKTFLEGQIRRLVASGEHSRLSILQGRDRLLYFDSLDNGAFKGVHNNAATKFCMVYFGLPVEPLTLINIVNAGKHENDARDEAKLDYSVLPRIYGGEADLEFLDKYNERSHGYPYLRITKATRPYKAIPEDITDLIREQRRIENELYPQPKMMCGGSFNSHMDYFGMDTYPPEPESPEPEVSEDNTQHLHGFGTLRGGAGPSQTPGDSDDEYNDVVFQPYEYFNEMEDITTDDSGTLELPDGDFWDVVFDDVPSSEDVSDSPRGLQHPSWMDGLGGGLRGGASPPGNSEDGVGQPFRASTLRSTFNNSPGRNLGTTAPVPATPRPTADIFGSASGISQRPSSVRRPQRNPGFAIPNSSFDPSLYEDYMIETAKTQVQDDLRVDAYRKEQSVHEPNPAEPEPTRYGKAIESQLVVGHTSPSVFTNNLSLDEIRALQDRNRQLENLSLDREIYCGLCRKSIVFTTKEQREAHFAGHVDGLHTCGFCGISFGSATRTQRQDHLASHADTRYTRQVAGTTQSTAAIRGSNTAHPSPTTDPAELTSNVELPSSVDGNVRLYCQNCGADLFDFVTPAQLIEHTQFCPRLHRQPSEPVYCKFCGVELAALGNAQDIRNHIALCDGTTSNQEGRQQALWGIAATVNKTNPEMTYWIMCALTGIPELHYKPNISRPGPYDCRYSGCSADLVRLAHDGTLGAHHKTHIARGDRLKYPCQADSCGHDLSRYDKMGQERLQRHLTRHLEMQCAYPHCNFKFRDEDLRPSTEDIERESKNAWVDHVQQHLLGLDAEQEEYYGSESDPPSDDDGHDGTQEHTNVTNIPTDTTQVDNGDTTREGDPKTGNPPGSPRPRPRPLQPPASGLHYKNLPKEWSKSLEMVPRAKSSGASKIRPWTFICPVCFLIPRPSMLGWHRSICPDGTPGCGVDDDDDWIIFNSTSTGRVRHVQDTYNYENMLNEGAVTWSVFRQRPEVAQYLIQHPISERQVAPNVPGVDVSSPKAWQASLKLKAQQAKTKTVLRSKAEKQASKVPKVPKVTKTTADGVAKTKESKRRLTDPPPGERPAKEARKTRSSLPNATTQIRNEPVVAAEAETGTEVRPTPRKKVFAKKSLPPDTSSSSGG